MSKVKINFIELMILILGLHNKNKGWIIISVMMRYLINSPKEHIPEDEDVIHTDGPDQKGIFLKFCG